MKNLFSTDKHNNNRQIELDIAKGLAIIFMIFVHCGMIANFFPNNESLPYYIIVEVILGGPVSAPVFMFCMGIVLHYARNKTPEAMIKRGIKLFILSIIVNIGEFIIPHFLFGTLFNSWNMINIHNGLSLFTVDILGFAALFFIVMGIFKKINLSNKQILAIGIVLSLVGSYFRFIDFGSASLNLLFGYFIGTSKAFTAFPLFNWIMFPIAGYVYGTYFINTKDKSRFFRFWPIFIIVSLTYLMIFLYLTSTSNNENIESLYYYMTTLELIFNLLYNRSTNNCQVSFNKPFIN